MRAGAPLFALFAKGGTRYAMFRIVTHAGTVEKDSTLTAPGWRFDSTSFHSCLTHAILAMEGGTGEDGNSAQGRWWENYLRVPHESSAHIVFHSREFAAEYFQ